MDTYDCDVCITFTLKEKSLQIHCAPELSYKEYTESLKLIQQQIDNLANKVCVFN